MKILYLHTRCIDESSANIIQVLWMCQTLGQMGHEVVLAVPEEKNMVSSQKSICSRLGLDQVDFNVIQYKRFTVMGCLKSIGCLLGCAKVLKTMDYDIVYIRVPVLLGCVWMKKNDYIFELHPS